MTVSDDQRRAICRISTSVGRGSGFLVARDLVLTAAHVVESGKGSKQPYPGGDIEVRFGNPGGRTKALKARVLDFDADRDCAALVLESPVVATPFACRALPSGHWLDWETYGYSDGRPIAGMACGGRVMTGDRSRFQLGVVHGKGPPAGLSGSPCIVDGEVVGILIEAADAAPGTLFAVCMSLVAATCSRSLKIRTVDEPPYLADVSAWLRKVPRDLLEIAAGKLGRPDPTAIQDASLPRAVADDTMRCAAARDLDGVLDALLPLTNGVDEAVQLAIVDLAARSWLSDQGAASLRQALDAKRAVALLNLEPERATVGSWYVHRAGCRTAAAPGRYFRSAHVNAEYSTAEVLAGRIVDALDASDMFSDLARPVDWPTFLAKHDHGRKPIVLILPHPITAAMLDELRSKHKLVGICFVVLAGKTIDATLAKGYEGAVIVPDVDDATAKEMIGRLPAARADIKDAYASIKRTT